MIWVRTGGTYQHNVAAAAGTVPTCSWETGSTLLITGYTTSTEELSLQGNPELENLTWNCTAQTGAIPFPSDFGSIHGTLTIASTGSGSIITNTTADNHVYTVEGDFVQTGGTLNLSSGSESSNFWVKGNVSLTGGALTETGSAGRSAIFLSQNAGNTPVNLTVADAFAFSNSVAIVIYGGATATLTQDCDLDGGSMELAGTLHCGTRVVRGASFSITTGYAVLGIGDEHGIAATASEGNIQTTTRDFSSNTRFRYECATGDSYTGDGLPDVVSVLCCANSAGALHLERDVSVLDSLQLICPLHVGTYNLTVGADAIVTATACVGADNSGTFRRNIGSSGSYLFPVGSENDDSPFTLTISAGGFSSAFVSVNVHTSRHPSNASANSYLTRYWSLSGSGFSGLSYDGSFTYVGDDVEGTESNIYGGRYDGSEWYLGDQTSTSTNTFTIQDQTAFGAVTGGESGSLPVQLTDARAWRSDGVAHVGWRTLSELNNYGFHVQRKNSGATGYVDLPDGFVPGHGTTVEEHAYDFVDHNPLPGASYYRLRQVDLNGGEHMMGEVCVEAATGVADPAQPRAFALLQNYPNPFNPSTTIAYDLPSRGTVRLEVCDPLGRTVAVPVNEVQSPGRHTVTFDASGLASGIYLYRLRTEDNMSVRAMVMVR
jgi:hypothetical protein